MDAIKELLKHEIDNLNEEELRELADFIDLLKFRNHSVIKVTAPSVGAKEELDHSLEPRGIFNNNPDYTPTGEILTIEEIRSRYPREWVLIADTETDEAWNVYRGEVLAHSPDRDVIDEALSKFKHIKSIAIEYTGPIPEDYAIML